MPEIVALPTLLTNINLSITIVSFQISIIHRMSEKDTLLMANNFSFSPLCFLIFWQTFQRSHLENLSILKNMRFVVHKKKD